MWWKIAASNPIEAVQSVLYPLMTLAEPERWACMEEDCMYNWTQAAFRLLSEKEQHLFAADCGDHILHVFESKHPEDLRPRQAVNARRYYARGEFTLEQWVAARISAVTASREITKDQARDVAKGNDWTTVVAVTKSTAWSSVVISTAGAVDGKAEQLWQWKHIQVYVRDRENP
jgi:hypothetical protein